MTQIAMELESRFGKGFKQISHQYKLKLTKSVLAWLLKNNILTNAEIYELTLKYLNMKC